MVTEQRIIIVSTGRNFEKYFIDWYKGIVSQYYKNFVSFTVDDNSTDNSSGLLLDFVGSSLLHLFPIWQKKRKWALYNKSIAILEHMNLKDDDIIIGVDLDDYLLTPFALRRINEIFSDPNIWFSYGNFDAYPNICKPYNWKKLIRQQSWRASHIRACRWFLMKNILKKDLQDENGKWYKFPEDRILSYPMLEMAGPEHVFCNKEILYHYRNDNPDCDMFVNKKEVQETLDKIYKKQPYECKTYEQLIAHENDWLE